MGGGAGVETGELDKLEGQVVGASGSSERDREGQMVPDEGKDSGFASREVCKWTLLALMCKRKEITSDIAILSRPAIWHGPILSCQLSRVPLGVLKIIL